MVRRFAFLGESMPRWWLRGVGAMLKAEDLAKFHAGQRLEA